MPSAWNKIRLEVAVLRKILALLTPDELTQLKQRKRDSNDLELTAPVLDELDKEIAARLDELDKEIAARQVRESLL